MDGDHMNINPSAPQLQNSDPSGGDLFFGRKWWYFNQVTNLRIYYVSLNLYIVIKLSCNDRLARWITNKASIGYLH